VTRPDEAVTLDGMAATAESAFAALRRAERLTVAGDWHGDAGWARHVINHAAQYDGARVIVQLGDFGIWPGNAGRHYLDKVARHLQAADAICLFLDGNHEDFPQLLDYPRDENGLRMVRPRLFHISRGTRWAWGELTVLAVGGATSLDRPWRRPMRDWWPHEELTRTDIDRAVRDGRCDVMLTHDAPAGIDVPNLPPPGTWDPDEVRRADDHRERLLEIVEQVRPRMLFHGHFHSRYDDHLRLSDGYTVDVTGLANEWTGTDGFIDVDRAALHDAIAAEPT
jgi:hypothetical protein